MNSASGWEQILEAITRHAPPTWQWLPQATMLGCLVVGLVFLVKGARLTPFLTATALGAFGAFGGGLVAGHFAGPVWPGAVIGGGIGLALGITLFRIWFAILVGVSLAAVGLSLYGGQVMLPALSEYTSRGVEAMEGMQEITLPAATQASTAAWKAELGEMWAFLGQRVPSIKLSLAAITLAAGTAGLVFALLLPKAARACWAATTGVVLIIPAAYGIACNHWPPAAAILDHWGLLIAAVLWSASLLFNLVDVMDRRPKKVAPQAEEEAAD